MCVCGLRFLHPRVPRLAGCNIGCAKEAKGAQTSKEELCPNSQPLASGELSTCYCEWFGKPVSSPLPFALLQIAATGEGEAPATRTHAFLLTLSLSLSLLQTRLHDTHASATEAASHLTSRQSFAPPLLGSAQARKSRCGRATGVSSSCRSSQLRWTSSRPRHGRRPMVGAQALLEAIQLWFCDGAGH